jgi:hypothetical protein
MQLGRGGRGTRACKQSATEGVLTCCQSHAYHRAAAADAAAADADNAAAANAAAADADAAGAAAAADAAAAAAAALEVQERRKCGCNTPHVPRMQEMLRSLEDGPVGGLGEVPCGLQNGHKSCRNIPHVPRVREFEDGPVGGLEEVPCGLQKSCRNTPQVIRSHMWEMLRSLEDGAVRGLGEVPCDPRERRKRGHNTAYVREMLRILKNEPVRGLGEVPCRLEREMLRSLEHVPGLGSLPRSLDEREMFRSLEEGAVLGLGRMPRKR